MRIWGKDPPKAGSLVGERKEATPAGSGATASETAATSTLPGASDESAFVSHGARAALKSLSLDVRSPEQQEPAGAESASLGAKLLSFVRSDGFKKGATMALLGVSLVGAVKPAMADTVMVEQGNSASLQRTARELATEVGEDFVLVRTSLQSLTATFAKANAGQLEMRHLILHTDAAGVDVSMMQSLKARYPRAFAQVRHVHVMGPNVAGDAFQGSGATLFPNARAIVTFDTSSSGATEPASSWVLQHTTKEARNLPSGRLSPQNALLEAVRLASQAASRGTTSVAVDGMSSTSTRLGVDTLAPAVSTAVHVPLGSGVGRGMPNKKADVIALQARLKGLGFPVTVDGKWGSGVERALRTFSSMCFGTELVRDAPAKVQPNDRLHHALESAGAPQWVRMPSSGAGFKNVDYDRHDYGSSVLAKVIESAGQRYHDDYLATNPGASLIQTNDASLRHGGDTRDHETHENGLDLDVRLPRTDGESGTRVGNANYDRSAARAMIKALIADPLVERVLIGDATLLREFRAASDADARKVQDGGRVHKDHIHVDVMPAPLR